MSKMIQIVSVLSGLLIAQNVCATFPDEIFQSSYLEDVREFAAQAHADLGQTYGYEKQLPYVVHLDEVVGVLKEFGLFDLSSSYLVEVIAAAYIHDLFEDTKVSRAEALKVASSYAVDYAHRVSDGEGATRAERKAGAYLKIKGVQGAVLVKLADRIANTRASNLWHMITYMTEYPKFRQELYDADMDLALPMWEELDRMFRIFGGLGAGGCAEHLN